MGIVIIPGGRNLSVVSSALTASNTTASNTLFTFTGQLKNCKIWGVVTTVLSSNITAAHFRVSDGTNTPAITLAAGTTLSSAPVGSQIRKAGLAGAAIVLNTSAQARVPEHATSGMQASAPFDLVAKAAATNVVQFTYSTTNTPATGVIQVFLEWEAGSLDASVT